MMTDSIADMEADLNGQRRAQHGIDRRINRAAPLAAVGRDDLRDGVAHGAGALGK